MEFNVLIIGSDANAYYLARCFHEEYHKSAYVLAREEFSFIKYSSIIEIILDDSIWDEDGFIKAIYKFKEEHGNKKTLLISSNETYAKFISKNRDRLIKDNFVFSYPVIDILETLIMKEKFYKTYQDSCIDLPVTYYFDCSKEKTFKKKMTYPVILKPSNVIMYNHLSFDGKNKIYKVENEELLNEIISKIISSGYTDTLIIQDFIPGDDSYLFDSVLYVDKNHKVKVVSFAQIGLQEHSKKMVGNAAVLINGYNEFGGEDVIIEKMIKFLEDINYQGFAEFDLKYDYRDKKFKVLEINARQGRSSYYISKLGCNLVKTLVDDLIYDKPLELKILKDKVLLSFVPKRIVKKYIINEKFKEEVLRLWKKRVNPLKYNKDTNFKRKIFLRKRDLRYIKEYKNGYWKN